MVASQAAWRQVGGLEEYVGTPWYILPASFLAAYLAAEQLAGAAVLFTRGSNLPASIALLLVAGLGALFRPRLALHLFLGMYVPLYMLANSGVVGNSIITYLSFVIGATLVLRPGSTSPWAARVPGAGFAVVLAGVAVLQWSRGLDFGASTRLLCDVVIFAAVLWQFTNVPGEDLRSAGAAFVLGVAGAATWLILKEFAPSARIGASLGVSPGFLGYAAGAAVLLLFSGFVRLRAPWQVYALAVPCMTLLYLTGSRTAFYGTLISLGLLFFLQQRYALFLGSLAVMVAGLYILYTGAHETTGVAHRLVTPFTESFEATSGGRARLWEYLWEQSSEHWLFGIGLGNTPILTGQGGLLALRRFPLHSHNLFLSVLLEFGILGFVLLLALQIRLLGLAAKYPRSAAVLIAIFVYYFFEGFFSGLNLSFLTAFMLLAGYYCCQQAQGLRGDWRLAAGYTAARVQASRALAR